MQGIAENLLSIASGTSSQAAATSLGLQSQVVLVLVGLIGSGKTLSANLHWRKSTFAQALQEHYSEFRRCSQDDLGDRRAVESLARRSLRKGHSVCIDRTNIDARQRSTWISIAREIPGTEVWILHFKTPFEVCEDRLRTRQNHPTITSPQQAVEILQRFRSQYQIPREHEGYDRELNLAVDEQQLGYTADDIRDILHRLQESPKIEQSGRWTNRRNNPSYRGQSNYRGYAGSRGSSEYSRGSQLPRYLKLSWPRSR
ncbi:AAA domain-containing protein [Irpex lacteus]|nr:AAA domain-containing protein [Irpex lacteus]